MYEESAIVREGLAAPCVISKVDEWFGCDARLFHDHETHMILLVSNATMGLGHAYNFAYSTVNGSISRTLQWLPHASQSHHLRDLIFRNAVCTALPSKSAELHTAEPRID